MAARAALVVGAGGTGTGGSARVIASTRFETTVRGSLSGGNLSINSDGSGGIGSTPGASAAGQFAVQATDADIALAAASLTSLGDQPPAAAIPASNLTVSNGTVAIDQLVAQVTGDLGLYVTNGGEF